MSMFQDKYFAWHANSTKRNHISILSFYDQGVLGVKEADRHNSLCNFRATTLHMYSLEHEYRPYELYQASASLISQTASNQLHLLVIQERLSCTLGHCV